MPLPTYDVNISKIFATVAKAENIHFMLLSYLMSTYTGKKQQNYNVVAFFITYFINFDKLINMCNKFSLTLFCNKCKISKKSINNILIYFVVVILR